MQLIIAGTGGHAQSVFDLALTLNHEIIGFLDPFSTVTDFNGLEVFREVESIPQYNEIGLILGIGSPSLRRKIVDGVFQNSRHFAFPNLIHPSAVISPRSSLGEGVSIFANTYVGPNSAIGNFGLINTGSCIEHDSNLESFVTIAPGVTCGGFVKIETGVTIGIGATLSNNVTIGRNSFIGGGSFVRNDVERDLIAYGVPARTVRKVNEPPYVE